ncbi:hypothetical protein B40_0103 [Lactococcus cremoris]|nr:hypothetical protein B40_0103 [Lactococcus cremoris]
MAKQSKKVVSIFSLLIILSISKFGLEFHLTELKSEKFADRINLFREDSLGSN